MKIDTKSAALGFLLALAAAITIAAGTNSHPTGHYQAAAGGGTVTIIDTTTGQAWSANLTTLNGTTPGFWTPKVED